jgi:hypothetical protein
LVHSKSQKANTTSSLLITNDHELAKKTTPENQEGTCPANWDELFGGSDGGGS